MSTTKNRRKPTRKKRQGWIENNVAYLPLTRGQVAKMDPEDLPWMSQWNWNALWSPSTKKYYATCKDFTTGVERNLRMNRFILGVTEDDIKVDHINHDTLDNRKENLRLATQGENLRNRGKQSNNKSGYKGVFFVTEKKKYAAKIAVDRKHIHLGYFNDAETAHTAYVAAAEKYHGDFACAS